jgi:pilus assembly protein CpaB
MKLLKNKTIIGIIAIVFGILVCFIVSPLYTKSLEEKTKVVWVDKYIEKGSLIKDGDVKIIDVGSYNLPKDIAKTKDEVVGKYALADMYPDDLLPLAKLSGSPLNADLYLEGLDGVDGAISVTLPSLASGLSNKLLSGDVISIITTDVNTGQTVIPSELKYVKVLACTNGSGKDIDEKTSSETGEEKENIATTLTLLVDDQQAMKLANLEKMQVIHIKLVYRGQEEKCNEFLDQQKIILEQQKTILEQVIAPATDQQAGTIVNETIEEGENIE